MPRGGDPLRPGSGPRFPRFHPLALQHFLHMMHYLRRASPDAWRDFHSQMSPFAGGSGTGGSGSGGGQPWQNMNDMYRDLQNGLFNRMNPDFSSLTPEQQAMRAWNADPTKPPPRGTSWGDWQTLPGGSGGGSGAGAGNGGPGSGQGQQAPAATGAPGGAGAGPAGGGGSSDTTSDDAPSFGLIGINPYGEQVGGIPMPRSRPVDLGGDNSTPNLSGDTGAGPN